MEKKKVVETCEGDVIGTMIGAIVLMGVVIWLSGCSALLGIKSYQSGDTRIDFVTGADFSIGANGIDRVDDRRGIDPRAR